MTATENATSIQCRIIETKSVPWRDFQFLQDETFKSLSDAAKRKLSVSILENNFAQPFYVWQDPSDAISYCLDGFNRVQILEELITEGHHVPDSLPATFIRCSNRQEAARLVLIYSSMYAKVTDHGLIDFMEAYKLNYEEMKMSVDLPDFDEIEFEGLLNATDTSALPIVPVSLTERYIIPPFSVLDSRQGYWQQRKKLWHSVGFDSQESREEVDLVARSGQAPAVYELRNKMREKLGREPSWDEILDYAEKKGLHTYEGASIFDPVLCEIMYNWFCPSEGTIFDPFAGGSVRGIVAAVAGFKYHGIDLRTEQVEANMRQAAQLNIHDINWYTGDSMLLNDLLPANLNFDFIFSCPPYHDLEKYSDDPGDLSNMDYETFLQVYSTIIFNSLQRLKANRFACFVVADIRDKQGAYKNFVSDTISAFIDQPLCDAQSVYLYNEIILINVAGSLPVRVGRQFASGRKVGKMHQNVLVFYKGDLKKIKEEFPAINIADYLQQSVDQPNIALSVHEN